VSEYQYYEFAAVDRPLGTRDIDTLRGLSTRAHITPTSFVNTYQWGSFKGEPRRLVERYFDAFLYLANWGTRELIMRLPARLVDPESAQRYCSGDAVSAWRTGDHVVVAAVSEDEEGDFEWGGEGVLASILPVRAEILAGDLRALYLLWLLSVQVGEISDDAVEPPVPASLDALTGSQTALVEFLRIDRDLVDVAATGSAPTFERRVDVARPERPWCRGEAPLGRSSALTISDVMDRPSSHERAESVEPTAVEHQRRGVRIRREGVHLEQHYRVVACRHLGVHRAVEPHRGSTHEHRTGRGSPPLHAGEPVAALGRERAAGEVLVLGEHADAEPGSAAQHAPRRRRVPHAHRDERRGQRDRGERTGGHADGAPVDECAHRRHPGREGTVCRAQAGGVDRHRLDEDRSWTTFRGRKPTTG